MVPLGLTLGGTVKGDPVKEIVKTAFDHGINFIDTAEGVSELSQFATVISRTVRTGYAAGQSEVELSAGFNIDF
jgi:diketogulonate reductase-like aldo/keto reductase